MVLCGTCLCTKVCVYVINSRNNDDVRIHVSLKVVRYTYNVLGKINNILRDGWQIYWTVKYEILIQRSR